VTCITTGGSRALASEKVFPGCPTRRTYEWGLFPPYIDPTGRLARGCRILWARQPKGCGFWVKSSKPRPGARALLCQWFAVEVHRFGLCLGVVMHPCLLAGGQSFATEQPEGHKTCRPERFGHPILRLNFGNRTEDSV
jgi:hypothetical protein